MASSREIGGKTSKKRKICLFARQIFTEHHEVTACSKPQKMQSPEQDGQVPSCQAVFIPGREDNK